MMSVSDSMHFTALAWVGTGAIYLVALVKRFSEAIVVSVFFYPPVAFITAMAILAGTRGSKEYETGIVFLGCVFAVICGVIIGLFVRPTAQAFRTEAPPRTKRQGLLLLLGFVTAPALAFSLFNQL